VKQALEALDKPASGHSEEKTVSGGSGTGRQAFLDAAARQIQAGQYGEAEAVLMEMLSREPGDPEVCRLLARLHLKRGEMSVAMGEFQFLAGAAMRAEDYGLAEAMLMEYLEVDPDCVLLMESLGQVYERKGDVTGAVQRYSQGLSMLLERPDPDQPTLPQELLTKIKELAPDSELIARFTEQLQPGRSQQVDTRGRATVAETTAPEADIQTELASTEPEMLEAVASAPGPESQEESVASALPQPAVLTHAEAVEQPEPEQQIESEDTPAEADVVASKVKDATVAAEPGPPSKQRKEARPPTVVANEPAPQTVGADAVMAVEPELQPPVASVSADAVQQRESHPDEVRARFDLAVAYKNMGLFDEAMEELRQTVTTKDYFLDSCCMIADCFRDQRETHAAIAHYEQALTAARDDDRATGIRYELGLLYEADGQLEKAVQIFAGLEEYRDVQERLERIKTDHTAEPVFSTADSTTTGKKRKKRRVSYL
jgi:tetratricopeptide (TPR) repeat protein